MRASLTILAALAASLVPAAPAGAAAYQVIDLGTLGGASSGATDLNDAGAAAGWSRTASGQVHAVVWRAGASSTSARSAGPGAGPRPSATRSPSSGRPP
jgi:uncharacterized membrane protein